MTDSETLFLALVIIYLIESAFWTRRGAIVFRALWGNDWRLLPSGGVLANDRGELFWGNPCPPFGCVHVTRTYPLCLSPSGVVISAMDTFAETNASAPGGKSYPFEAIKSVQANEKKLLINGELVWRSDSVHQPAVLARLLRELLKRPQEARAERIRQELSARLNSQEVLAQRKVFLARTRLLHLLTLILFVFLFGVCPLAVWRIGLLPMVVPLIAILFAQTLFITILFWRLHKQWFYEAADDRFKLGMLTLLVPAVSIRARDLLSRPLLENFHPLAVANALLPRNDFIQSARLYWRHLKYPALPRLAPGHARETEDWFREELLNVSEAFLREQGLQEDAWTKPPASSDPAHKQFCPRCEAQFTAQATACTACGGRPLEYSR